MKQVQKNKTLAGLLLILTVVVAILFLTDKNGNVVDRDLFKVEGLSNVDKVILKSTQSQIELTYDGTRWKVNGVHDADDQMITVLFATLQQAEPKRKVPQNQQEEVSGLLASKGISITLYHGQKMLNQFTVGGNQAKSEAYFADEKNAYVMTIPGYRVYVAGIFELDESGWRDKRIFNFNWRNFKKLAVKFPAQPAHNFDVEDLGSGFQITQFERSDTTRLNDYLDAVSLLVAREIIQEGYSPRYDSLLGTVPDLIIEVYDLGSNKFQLDLFRPLPDDPNALGKLGDEDIVLFDRSQVMPIMKTKDYFLK